MPFCAAMKLNPTIAERDTDVRIRNDIRHCDLLPEECTDKDAEGGGMFDHRDASAGYENGEARFALDHHFAIEMKDDLVLAQTDLE